MILGIMLQYWRRTSDQEETHVSSCAAAATIVCCHNCFAAEKKNLKELFGKSSTDSEIVQ